MQIVPQSAFHHANREASPMASYLRLIVPFAAAVAAAGVLSIAPPASAAGFTIGAGEAASANATGARPVVRHRTSPRIRLATSRDHRRDRYVRPIRNDMDCSGAWCRRQFVLMIGIAY
jgi:hypothetical protein